MQSMEARNVLAVKGQKYHVVIKENVLQVKYNEIISKFCVINTIFKVKKLIYNAGFFFFCSLCESS